VNLLLNLLGLGVHLSDHLVDNGDGLGKAAIMTLHLVEARLFSSQRRREKRIGSKQTLFNKVEMVALNPWERVERGSTSCPLW